MPSQLKKIEDNHLIDLYMDSQNQLYFNELYGRYANKIYGKCLSILKDVASAEDAAQEVFMKIFLRLASFNRKSKFSTWVYSITYNYCIDVLRKQKRRFTVSTDDERMPEVADENEISDAEFLEMDLKRLGKALNEIPESDKAVLLMKYQEGIPIKELAVITNKSESAVKMKLKRAKSKVHKIYEGMVISVLIIISLWLKK